MDTTQNETWTETPVLMLVSDPGNQRVLEDWVQAHEQYRLIGDDAEIGTADFECCLLDREMLLEHREVLLDRKHNAELLLPYLLLVPNSNHSEIRQQLERTYPDLWAAIDGLIDMPVSNMRLEEQLEMMLRLREQSTVVHRQREQLDVLNRVLRHDIRNDVHVILAWADNLKTVAPTERDQSIEKIQRAGKHIVELTTSAHDIAEMIYGDQSPEFSVLSLERILSEELEKRRETHPHADISMPEPSSQETKVKANEMLASVFRNLVNNAIQHNDSPDPEVTITVKEVEDTVRINVADNGPGIPDEQKDRLFSEGETGMDSEGTGMGLYLVARLVDSYGGDVWIEDRQGTGELVDTSADRGTEFVVELPVAVEQG